MQLHARENSSCCGYSKSTGCGFKYRCSLQLPELLKSQFEHIKYTASHVYALFSTEEKNLNKRNKLNFINLPVSGTREDKPANSSNSVSEKLTWGYVLRVMQEQKVTLLLQALPICLGFILLTEEEVRMRVLDMNFL